MIHANRTYLLQLKKKEKTVAVSLGIIKARRQALLQKFIEAARPFLKTRKEISASYSQALSDLHLAIGHHSEPVIHSIAAINRRQHPVTVQTSSILGVPYHEVASDEKILRDIDGRQYDVSASSPRLEESMDGFEKLIESILDLATLESKVKQLGHEIQKLSRQMRVLEERILPEIQSNIRSTAQQISEREREEYYRLKKFKTAKQEPTHFM